MMLLLRVAVLTLVWLALWSDLSAANLVSGLAVSSAVVLLDARRRGRVIVRPIAAVRFALYFLYKLVASTVTVARTIMSPRDRIHAGIIALPLVGCSDAVVTLIADAISLTPGTLTLEIRREPLTLYVHTLDAREADQLRHDVRTLQVLAIRAFGDEAAAAGLGPEGNARSSR